jgi:flagellar export protein FliJ
MRRFRFRLERLLWHRRCQEELAEQALGKALRQELELASDLARVGEQSAAEAAGLRTILDQSTTGIEMRLHAWYAAGLAAREAFLVERREAAVSAVADHRATLLERRRAHEVVVQLRERMLARYQRAAEREAQLALDETASVRHVRRIREMMSSHTGDATTAESDTISS